MIAARQIDRCRVCGGALSIPFCDLGATPLANAFVAPEDAARPDQCFPLRAVVCDTCFLVQLDHIADASGIFQDYAYFSSFSSGWLAHAAGFARDAIARHGLGSDSLVVEIASNDGYLLRNFVTAGIPCLGVEPAANIAPVAVASGVPTLVAFFGQDCARQIVAERGHARLVVANNVLAHVPDLNDFIAGLAILAGPVGTVSIEAPHLLALVEQVQFDTIYHEHYAYWSLHAMTRALERHGLHVYRVDRLATHGTSLRVHASMDRSAGDLHGAGELALVQAAEREAQIDRPAFYRGFDARVGAVLDAFRAFLADAKRAGRRIAAYGAAAKGNTFLNAAGVSAGDLLCVADRNPAKQGRLLPGSRIPIVTPDAMLAARPDDILILPWNLAQEIASELTPARDRGARLLVAVPHLRTIAWPV
jgi:C-methyltransferase-like protein/putative zinc binding protein/methyltransferase family protein